jgi:clan AA aspartic protease (TIGR02281 family)
MYYAALAHQAAGDAATARRYYQTIMTKFPSTQAGQLAAQALGYGGQQSIALPSAHAGNSPYVVHGTGTAGGGGDSGGSDADSGPQESKVYFTMDEHAKMLVDAFVNGRAAKMTFDTGAEGCYFTKDQILALGINPPEGPPTGTSIGAGGAPVQQWQMPLDIQVGPIRKHIVAGVGASSVDTGPPLLGQSFFAGSEYSIDQGAHAIVFRRKTAASGNAADLYSIPFTKRAGVGADLQITAEVHGHRCPILFDTGAQTTIMSMSNLQQLGLSVPEDAQKTAIRGVGGERSAYLMTLDELRVGPVVKRGFQVTVVDSGDGLLGQDFFSDWRFTIDNTNHLIKLFH